MRREFANQTGMRRIGLILALFMLALVAYLSLWPVPIRPVSWHGPTAPGYTGPHAQNNRLAGLQMIPLGDEEAPEHVAIGRDGKLYAAMASGNIIRMNPDGTAPEVFAYTGGRPLGFDFDAAGSLIVADAMKGLLSITPDRDVTVLVDNVGGDPIGFANAVAVADNGRIYFSDATSRFAPAESGGISVGRLDVIENSSTGRVLEQDPTLETTRIVARGLSFANGMALSGDETTLFVAETGRYRVWKLAVAADNVDVTRGSPHVAVLFDNLPGFPDNLTRGLDGRIWLGLARPRNPALDAMADKPHLRKVLLRVPRALWPEGKGYGHVAFTEDGRIVADLQDPTGEYPQTTGVTETRERLYVQTLYGNSLGWMATPSRETQP